MESMYPYVETLKVAAAYVVLLYVWPNILFRRVLRERGLTFRFLFSAVIQPVLISTVVLGLGLLHLLNIWIIRMLFWGPLAASLLDAFRRWHGQTVRVRLPIRSLLSGSYGWKLFFSRVAEALIQRWKRYWRRYRDRGVEYLVLAAVLLFGMAFFLNGPFRHYSFGCNDQYTHFEWTEALLRGEIFSDGVYPQGMHCFLYALHGLFGVNLYSCVLFLAGIHNSTSLLLAAYCLFKELFHSRHTPLLALAAWVAFNGVGPTVLEALNRLSWTLPQEFGLYLVFLCPLFLLRYFRQREKPAPWYQNEHLLFLAVSVAGAVSTHYYVLIMAFFLSLAVILVYHREWRPGKPLLQPVISALYGLELGALPMLAAFATGTPLQVSLLWGLSVAQGTGGTSSAAAAAEQELYANPNLPERVAAFLRALNTYAHTQLFGTRTIWTLLLIFLVPALLVLCWCAGRREKPRESGLLYALLPLGCVFFFFLSAAPYVGLPKLIAIDRTEAVTQILVFGLALVPLDVLLTQANRVRGKELPRGLIAAGCLVLYLFAYQMDHQRTLWWLHRYNAAVTVTEQIMDYYPEGSYHIVSMYDEAFQAGRENHEDLFTFLQNVMDLEYSLPREYIFLYVEKRPIMREQPHFLASPRWLARNNSEVVTEAEVYSQCPDILHTDISEKLLEEEREPILKYNYNDLNTRAVLCAKAFQWYQGFAKVYPAETNIYYEDDDLICYVIHQNPKAPLDLTQGRR